MTSPLDYLADKRYSNVLDEQVRCLDALAAPLVKSLASVLACSHPADIHPSVIVLCSSTVALHRAVKDAQRDIGRYEDAHACDVPPELVKVGEAVKEAAKEFFEAVQGAVFSGLIMPRYEWRGESADLRLVADHASSIIDRIERHKKGIPTNREYRRDRERAEGRYYTFINALLHVLALDTIRAATKRGDVSEAARTLVSKMFELSRVLEKERELFEADGIEAPLLSTRAQRKALQDEITDKLRA
ncbi:MAG TPA: hypothetical protein VIE66_20880, partial [Methylocella sp.]